MSPRHACNYHHHNQMRNRRSLPGWQEQAAPGSGCGGTPGNPGGMIPYLWGGPYL